MIFENTIYFKIGIFAYICIWAYFKYRHHKFVNKNATPNVFEIEKSHNRCVMAKYFGWMFGFFVMFLAIRILPIVKVVTPQSPYTKHIEWGVVPFYYKGNFCAPCKTYLSNESDKNLVMYSTDYYSGIFSVYTTIYKRDIPCHSFKAMEKGIDNYFTHPREYGFYRSEQHRNKPVTEWTIDTEDGAETGIKYVQKKIKERMELIKRHKP